MGQQYQGVFLKRFAQTCTTLCLTYMLGVPGCATSQKRSSVINAPSTSEVADFIPHTESKPFGSYLAMNLADAPYKPLQPQIEVIEGLSLKSRGEAHITVITPLEYENILKNHISIEEINTIALESGIQSSHIQNICIGRGQKVVHGKIEKTHYVVIDSPNLFKIRRLIHSAYIKKGGNDQDFKPEHFFPHVTIGFTLKDLHFEDGITKDKESCVYYFAK